MVLAVFSISQETVVYNLSENNLKYWNFFDTKVSKIEEEDALHISLKGRGWYSPAITTNTNNFLFKGYSQYIISFNYEILSDFDQETYGFVEFVPTEVSSGKNALGTWPYFRLPDFATSKEEKKGSWSSTLGYASNSRGGEIPPDGKYQLKIGFKRTNYSKMENGKIIISNLKIEEKGLNQDGKFQNLKPKALFPFQDQSISEESRWFFWRPVFGSQFYDIQISKYEDFRESYANQIGCNGSDQIGYRLASDAKLEGTFFWRVRGKNYKGENSDWSSAQKINFLKEKEVIKINKTIDIIQKPYFILYFSSNYPDQLVEFYERIPEELKKNIIFEIPMAQMDAQGANQKINVFCKQMEQLRLKGKAIPPISILVRIFGDVTGGRYSTVSIPEIEKCFQEQYPWIVGVSILEQHIENEEGTRMYLEDLIKISGKYKKPVFWAEFGPQATLLERKNEKLFNAISENTEIINLSFKWNDVRAPILKYNNILALWLGGKIGEIGTSAEAWYWATSQFGALNSEPGSNQVRHGKWYDTYSQFPDTFWGIQLLLGLSQGSQVYRIEGSSFWETEFNPPQRSDIMTSQKTLGDPFQKVMIPLLKRIRSGEIIPSKTEVMSKVKAIVSTSLNYSHGWDNSFEPFQNLYTKLYKIDHRHDGIPNTSQFYFLPTIFGERSKEIQWNFPKDIPVIEFNADVFTVKDEEKFNKLYLSKKSENAFHVNFSKFDFVVNSNENKDISETFQILTNHSKVKRIFGEVGVHQYVLAGVSQSKLWIEVNNRRERVSKFYIQSSEKPAFKVIPDKSLLSIETSKEKDLYEVSLKHENGNITLEW